MPNVSLGAGLNSPLPRRHAHPQDALEQGTCGERGPATTASPTKQATSGPPRSSSLALLHLRSLIKRDGMMPPALVLPLPPSSFAWWTRSKGRSTSSTRRNEAQQHAARPTPPTFVLMPCCHPSRTQVPACHGRHDKERTTSDGHPRQSSS